MSHDPNQTADFRTILHTPLEPATTEVNQQETAGSDQTGEFHAAASTVQPVSTNRQHVVPTITGYQIEAELGRGGMGVVYKAQQTDLRRPVAIKMILGGKYTDPVAQARFLVEAEVIALLTDPRIVQVFEFGRCDDQPYFVLEYVGGGSLAGRLRQGKPTARESATMVAELAEGIAAAHQKGVVHRDLKPANVLLTETGEPKITDFGLAKTGDSELTASGAVMGTPSYMSPEQASGRTREVGTLTDVYALGAILYEMLTGRPPFKSDSIMETIQQVIDREPVRPRVLDATIPHDLETICLKCLEKTPSKRYGSASELAVELKTYLDGRPISARPLGTSERVWKWVRRNKVLALAGSAVAIVLCVATIVSLSFGLEAQKQADSALKQQKAAEDASGREKMAADEAKARAAGEKRNAEAFRRQLQRAETVVYRTQLADAQRFLNEGLSREARNRLDETRWDLRGWEYQLLASDLVRSPMLLPVQTSAIGGVAWSPDGKAIVGIVADQQRSLLRVWSVNDGSVLAELRGHTGSITAVCWSPDGSRLLSGAGIAFPNKRSGEAIVWDWKAGKAVFTFATELGGIAAVGWSPDGKRLATGDVGSNCRLWNADDGQLIETIPANKDSLGISCLCWNPSSTQLATASGSVQATAEVWDVTVKPAVRLKTIKWDRRGANRVTTMAWGPEGHRLAAGAWDGSVRVWDVRTGNQLHELKGHTGQVLSVSWCPDGSRLVSGSIDTSVRLWDAKTGTMIELIKGHTSQVLAVAFSPDGRRIASGSADRTLRVWDDVPAQPPLVLGGYNGPVFSLAWSPNGRYLATSPFPGEQVIIRSAQSGQEVTQFGAHLGPPTRAIAWSPDSTKLVVGGDGKTAKVWQVANSTMLRELNGHTGPIQCIAWSTDGQFIATGSSDKTVRVWEATTGQSLHTITDLTTNIPALAWSPTGQLAVATDTTVRLWNPATKQVDVELTNHPGTVWCLSWGKENQLAVATRTGIIRLWDVAERRALHDMSGHTALITGLCWTSDGTRLTSGSYDQTVRLWDPNTGQQVTELRGHEPGVTCLGWSPDGRRLAVGTTEILKAQAVRIWEASTPPQPRRLMGLVGSATAVQFSPDGLRLSVRTTPQSVATWNMMTGQREETPDTLATTAGTSATSPDGEWRAWIVEGLVYVARQADEERAKSALEAHWVKTAQPDGRWHTQQAQFAEQRTDWFAARFHLRALLAVQPSADIQRRLLAVEGKLAP